MELSRALEECSNKVSSASSSALHVFNILNEHLDFMWWMLDFTMESEDSSAQFDYKLRMKEDENPT